MNQTGVPFNWDTRYLVSRNVRLSSTNPKSADDDQFLFHLSLVNTGTFYLYELLDNSRAYVPYSSLVGGS